MSQAIGKIAGRFTRMWLDPEFGDSSIEVATKQPVGMLALRQRRQLGVIILPYNVISELFRKGFRRLDPPNSPVQKKHQGASVRFGIGQAERRS